MKPRRLFTTIAAALCAVAGLSIVLAFALDSPGGLDARDDELSPPVMLMPRSEPMSPLSVTADQTSTDLPESGNPLWGIPIESLHATRERPLFSPSRRPPMPAVIAAPPKPVQVSAKPVQVSAPVTPERPTLNLLGVVIGSGEAYAVFINNTTHDIVQLKTGEGEDGWILRSVSSREAVLEKNHRTAVIGLPPITGVPK